LLTFPLDDVHDNIYSTYKKRTGILFIPHPGIQILDEDVCLGQFSATEDGLVIPVHAQRPVEEDGLVEGSQGSTRIRVVVKIGKGVSQDVLIF
jgi:hypothetical protein